MNYLFFSIVKIVNSFEYHLYLSLLKMSSDSNANAMTESEKITLVNQLIESDLNDQLSTGKYVISISVSILVIFLICSAFYFNRYARFRFHKLVLFLFVILLLVNVGFSSARISDKFQENAANYTSLVITFLALMLLTGDMKIRNEMSIHSSMNYVILLMLLLTNAMLLILSIVRES